MTIHSDTQLCGGVPRIADEELRPIHLHGSDAHKKGSAFDSGVQFDRLSHPFGRLDCM